MRTLGTPAINLDHIVGTSKTSKAKGPIRQTRAANKRAITNAAGARTRGGRIHFGKSQMRAQEPGENGDDFVELFGVEPFLRNQVTKENILHLQNRVDSEGTPKVAESLGISEVTLLRVMAGFGHRLQPKCAAKVRGYFGAK